MPTKDESLPVPEGDEVVGDEPYEDDEEFPELTEPPVDEDIPEDEGDPGPGERVGQ